MGVVIVIVGGIVMVSAMGIISETISKIAGHKGKVGKDYVLGLENKIEFLQQEVKEFGSPQEVVISFH